MSINLKTTNYKVLFLIFYLCRTQRKAQINLQGSNTSETSKINSFSHQVLPEAVAGGVLLINLFFFDFYRKILVFEQACNFIKTRLQHRCFPVNVAKFLRTPASGCFYAAFHLKVKLHYCSSFHKNFVLFTA